MNQTMFHYPRAHLQPNGRIVKKSLWTARAIPIVIIVASVVSFLESQRRLIAVAAIVDSGALAKGATGSDWPSYGGTGWAWRYSSLDQINTTNITHLVPAWVFQAGEGGLQSTPIVVDGVLYLTSTRDHVFALNAATGELVWDYPFQEIPGTGNRQNKGVAVSDGNVFLATADSHLVSLDAKTGAELWKVAVDDVSTCQCGITAAPLVVKDKIVVSEGGATRGHITAFNAKTGRLEWRFYTVPGPGEKGNETWAGDSWKRGVALPWTTGSFDPDLNLVYWGAGEPKPMFYGLTREGINLYSTSILALDANTGKLRWYFQEVPHDTWDWDASWEIVLLNREFHGRTRKLLVHLSKGGYAFVLDRETGEFLNAYPVADNITWIKDVDSKGELVGRRDAKVGEPYFSCPSAIGTKSWNQSAFSPRTGMIYFPETEMCQELMLNPPAKDDPDDFGGATFVMKPPPGHKTPYSHLDALDPVTGKKKWSYPYKFELYASILATGGDLIFTGDPEGHFFALDANTGRKLWSFQTGSGNKGSAVTYSVKGRQYVATPTGWGGGITEYTNALFPEGAKRTPGSALVVFALPELPH